MTDGLARIIAAGSFPSGFHVAWLPETESTQDVARAAARGGASERSVWVADYQFAGRGRQGRVWLAPPGSSLMLSMLFRLERRMAQAHRCTMLVSTALCRAVLDVAPNLEPRVKWPNDVMLGRRKLAGVLAEAAWEGDQATVIVGVGVNVHAVDPAMADRAVALDEPAGRSVDRGLLLARLLARIDELDGCGPDHLVQAWQALLWGRDQPVRLRLADGTPDRTAVVLGALPDGRLRVRLDDGTELVTATAELLP
ncbi:MAG: biotin--[acetyl-CoA-carboxylase] ligase [Chloroflexi bacterium]|nr:biotin--[acetyl-CoA-carboxylase] ligase [Chloroflexota bacterium]